MQRYPTARYFNSIAQCNNIHKDNNLTILHYYTTGSTVTIFQQYFKVQQNPPGQYFKKQAHRQLTKSNSPLIWHLAKYRFRVGTDSAAHTCTHRYQCIAMVKLRRSKIYFLHGLCQLKWYILGLKHWDTLGIFLQIQKAPTPFLDILMSFSLFPIL